MSFKRIRCPAGLVWARCACISCIALADAFAAFAFGKVVPVYSILAQASDGPNLVGPLTSWWPNPFQCALWQYSRTCPNCYCSKRMLGDTPFDRKTYRGYACDARIRLRG